jgi:KAP family P-loop domain
MGLAVDPGALLRGAGGLLSGTSIQEMKDRVSTVLRQQQKRVVILIDDVDRLDITETYLLFRLVKLVADFENTTYILAFDDRVVAEALRQRYPEQLERLGEGFVDKIIQVPLHLPPARLDLVHGIVFEGIDQLMQQEGLTLEREDVIRFRRAFDVLAVEIDTPRMAGRYLNALLFAVPGIKSEVDVIDLLLIEALRVVAPSVHQWIAQNKAFLAQPSTHVSVSAEHDRDHLNGSTKSVTGSQVQRVQTVLSSLFPRAGAILNVFGVGAESDDTLGKGKRIASAYYFDRYFLYAIPADDVSDAEIESFVAAAQAESETLPDVFKGIASTESFGLVLTKLGQRVDQLPTTAIPALIRAIAATGESLQVDRVGVFSLSIGEKAALLVRDLLRNLSNPVERLAFAEQLVRETQPLEFALEIYRWLSPSDEPNDPIDEAGDAKLKDSLATRILEANSTTPLFLSSPEWAARYYWLVTMSNHVQELRDQFDDQVVDSSTAVSFVRAFMSSAMDVQTQKQSLYLDTRAVESAIGLVSYERLREFLEPIATVSSLPENGERFDLSDANDSMVAARFIAIGQRRIENQGSSDPSESSGSIGGP